MLVAGSADLSPRATAPLLLASPGFAAWLAEAQVTFAVRTYQAGRIIFPGQKADGTLRADERFLDHCQGMDRWADALGQQQGDPLALRGRSATGHRDGPGRHPPLRAA